MKIAVTATGDSLDVKVDPRFGRCPYFLIVDTETMALEAAENPNVVLGGGAGVQSGQLMAEKSVEFVLTGNCGPNAHHVLNAAGINVITGCSGIVKDVVEQFKAGQLSIAGGPTVPSHFGISDVPDPPQAKPMPSRMPPMGRGSGQGQGRGMGRGRGQGMGLGRGIDMNAGFSMGSSGAGLQQPVEPPLSKEEKLAMLKQEAEDMTKQIEQVQGQIRRLEQEEHTVGAKVDIEKCTGCGACVDVCPLDAIQLENGVAVVDQETCTECGACVDACPVGAISLP